MRCSILALLLLTSCVRHTMGPRAEAPGAPVVSPAAVDTASVRPEPLVPPRRVHWQQLRLRLEAPDTARTGEPVLFRITLANPFADTVTTSLRSRPIFDVQVRDSRGLLMWRRLPAEIFTNDDAFSHVLAPGEAVTLEQLWDQRGRDGRLLPRGRYTLRGVVELTDSTAVRTLIVR
jgi:hypothetical protein